MAIGYFVSIEQCVEPPKLLLLSMKGRTRRQPNNEENNTHTHTQKRWLSNKREKKETLKRHGRQSSVSEQVFLGFFFWVKGRGGTQTISSHQQDAQEQHTHTHTKKYFIGMNGRAWFAFDKKPPRLVFFSLFLLNVTKRSVSIVAPPRPGPLKWLYVNVTR